MTAFTKTQISDITADQFISFDKPTCISAHSDARVRFSAKIGDVILLKMDATPNGWITGRVLDLSPNNIVVEIEVGDSVLSLTLPHSKISAILLGE